MELALASEHITKAYVYDSVRHEMTGSIMAGRVDPKQFPSSRYHFYCAECLDNHGHYARIRRVKEQNVRDGGASITLPDRFVLYGRNHSVHQCNHRLRFQELDNLAERYQAHNDGSHAYSFLMNMAGCNDPISSEGVLESVHSAERLRKILYSCMYDENLLQRQRLFLSGSYVPLRETVYDDERRSELVSRSVVKSSLNEAFYAAVIFKPMARRDFWHALTDEKGIPGQPAGSVKINGAVLRPNILLRFTSQEVCEHARGLVSRDGGNNSAAILAFGRAVTEPRYVRQKVRTTGDGEQVPVLQTALWVASTAHVTEWNYPTSFNQMIDGQINEPVAAAQTALRL